MYKTAIKIIKATVGIQANKKELLPEYPLKIEVKSLLTDFKEMVKIDYTPEVDGQIFLDDNEEEGTFYEFLGEKAIFRGPLLKLQEEASDLRFSFWGNQGFLYRYVQFLLEKKYQIYNFHACGLYDEKKECLYIIAGGAGSGKTVFLLSGLARGLKLFSTETVHFNLQGDKVLWFMGSLVDNVRVGTLRHNFPQFLLDLAFKNSEPEEWQKKIALDLSAYQYENEMLNNPQVIILFPRIEEGRKGFHLHSIEDRRKEAKAIFDNLSQKIAETFVLYDKMIIPGLDNSQLGQSRLNSAYKLAGHPATIQIATVLTNPYECWGNLLD